MIENDSGSSPSRPKRHWYTLIAVLCLSALATLYSLSYDVGGVSNPGPGLWPTIGSAVALLCTTGLLVWEHTSDDYEEYSPDVRDIPVALGLVIVFGYLLGYIGLTIPIFVFLLAWMKILGREPWGLSLMVAAFGSAVIFIAFDGLLGIPFPQDILVERIRF